MVIKRVLVNSKVLVSLDIISLVRLDVLIDDSVRHVDRFGVLPEHFEHSFGNIFVDCGVDSGHAVGVIIPVFGFP